MATTLDLSTVAAGLGGGTIHAGDVTVSASNTSDYAPSANSINAAALGASGATATAIAITSATTTLADNTTINASGLVTVEAQNVFNETTTGDSAQAGAGGLINGSAA